MKKFVQTILAIAGIIPEHLTFVRILFLTFSIGFSLAVLPNHLTFQYAFIYLLLSTVLYIGWVCTILPKKGLRLYLIEKYGETKAYLYHEAILAFAFLHNGIALSHMSQSTANNAWFHSFPSWLILSIAVVLFVVGMGTKIWSAYVAGIATYYYKDMFLGRKIAGFVVKGPYRYIPNPMYGIGQLQVYAIAIYYHSACGILFGAINQLLVFSYYFTIEKPFVQRIYSQPEAQQLPLRCDQSFPAITGPKRSIR